MKCLRAIVLLTMFALLNAVWIGGCQSTAAPQTAAAPAGDSSVADQSAAPRASEVASEPSSEQIDPEIARATIEAAWSAVEQTHFDPNFNGVDWHAVREEFLPRAEEVATMNELRGVVQEMLGRLNQSHFALLPDEFVDALDAVEETDAADAPADESDEPAAEDRPEPRKRGLPDRPSDVGIDSRLVDEKLLITSVKPGSPAAEAGMRTGWAIEFIGPRDIGRLIELAPDHLDDRMRQLYMWHAAMSQLEGEEGTTIAIKVRDEQDEQRTIELKRVPVQGERIKFGDLPTFYAELTHERVEAGSSAATAGVISFNIWMVPIARPFDEAVDAMRDVDGIIIDLRGNPGGVGAMAMGIAGHFLDERISLGTMITRDSELRFVANPRRVSTAGKRVQPFSGPLAILVDAQTGSTSEIFAAGMQALGRAHVFGQTTMGAALPAMTRPLPNGDFLLHAIGNFVDANGEEVEGRGVVPDVPAPPTRADLLAGRDNAREAAIAWIASQSASNRESGM